MDYNSLTITVEPKPGSWAVYVARDLATLATLLNSKVETIFHGRLMEAWPDDDPNVVYDDWERAHP